MDDVVRMQEVDALQHDSGSCRLCSTARRSLDDTTLTIVSQEVHSRQSTFAMSSARLKPRMFLHIHVNDALVRPSQSTLLSSNSSKGLLRYPPLELARIVFVNGAAKVASLQNDILRLTSAG